MNSSSAPPRSQIWRKNLALLILSALVTVLLSIGLDRLLGLAVFRRESPGVHAPIGLISTPNSKVSYVTSEFSFIASTNSLGFRDAELDVDRRRGLRVVALGDSFTYGWGVGDSDSWPKVLERNLRDRGIEVEVVNLGWPGMSPSDYVGVGEKAIPLLKPDLVIVAVLQGEDYAQLWLETQSLKERWARRSAGEVPGLMKRSVQRRMDSSLRLLYPSFFRYLERSTVAQETDTTTEVSASWREMARQVESDFTAVERERFERIGVGLRADFRSGKLNPTLISRAVRLPEYFRLTEEWNTPRGLRVVDTLSQRLARIRAIAEKTNARVIVVPVPFGAYVNHPLWESIQALGYQADSRMLSSEAADEAVRKAALGARVVFDSVTGRFREKSSDPSLYFPKDTHFTSSGHKLFADLLTPSIATALEPVRP